MSLPIQNHYTFPNIGDIANLIQGGVNLVSGLNTESTDMAVSDFELVKPTLNGLVLKLCKCLLREDSCLRCLLLHTALVSLSNRKSNHMSMG